MSTGELLNFDPKSSNSLIRYSSNSQPLQHCSFQIRVLLSYYVSTVSDFTSVIVFLVTKVELKKQISCNLQLSNKTDDYVAYKVKTTNPKKYCVRPNTGVVLPRSTCDVVVTMQAQKEKPSDMQCKDKFLLQSVVASAGATTKDITPEMFNKESGHNVEECKLKINYVDPPRPPSPVREGSEEGSSPRASVDNGNSNDTEFKAAKSLIASLTEQKNSAIQQNNRLQQELDLLRREANTSRGGIAVIYVVIVVGLIGINIILGYLLKKT